MHCEPQTVDSHHHRIDQKWHVVVDDFDHRVIGMPSMLLKIWVVYPQTLPTRHELLRCLPVCHGATVQIGEIAALNVLGVGEFVVVTQERFDDVERGLR